MVEVTDIAKEVTKGMSPVAARDDARRTEQDQQRDDLIQRMRSEVVRLRAGQQSQDIERLIQELEGLCSGLSSGTIPLSSANAAFSNLRVEANKEIAEAEAEEAEEGVVAGMIIDGTAYAATKISAIEQLRAKARANLAKNIDGFIDTYIDNKASEGQRRIISSSIKIAMRSPEVAIALDETGRYSPEQQLSVQMDKEKFFNYIDKMLADDPRGKYSDTLKEMRAFEVYSVKSISLLNEMSSQKIDPNQAYAAWLMIQKEDYDSQSHNAKKSMNGLREHFPALVDQFNQMDFETELKPLILKFKSDPKLQDSIVKAVDELTDNPNKWASYPPETQKLIIAYLAEAPLHVASDSICTNGVLKFCHMIPAKDVEALKAVDKHVGDASKAEGGQYSVSSPADASPKYVVTQAPDMIVIKPSYEETPETSTLAQVDEKTAIELRKSVNQFLETGLNPDMVAFFDVSKHGKVNINEVIAVLQKTGIKPDAYKGADGEFSVPEITEAMQVAMNTAKAAKPQGPSV